MILQSNIHCCLLPGKRPYHTPISLSDFKINKAFFIHQPSCQVVWLSFTQIPLQYAPYKRKFKLQSSFDWQLTWLPLSMAAGESPNWRDVFRINDISLDWNSHLRGSTVVAYSHPSWRVITVRRWGVRNGARLLGPNPFQGQKGQVSYSLPGVCVEVSIHFSVVSYWLYTKLYSLST